MHLLMTCTVSTALLLLSGYQLTSSYEGIDALKTHNRVLFVDYGALGQCFTKKDSNRYLPSFELFLSSLLSLLLRQASIFFMPVQPIHNHSLWSAVIFKVAILSK